jgi:hypothetical protein
MDIFVSKINDLKENFDRGINVQTWIHVHNIEHDLRQLSSTLEEINALGQISSNRIVCYPNRLKF